MHVHFILKYFFKMYDENAEEQRIHALSKRVSCIREFLLVYHGHQHERIECSPV